MEEGQALEVQEEVVQVPAAVVAAGSTLASSNRIRSSTKTNLEAIKLVAQVDKPRLTTITTRTIQINAHTPRNKRTRCKMVQLRMLTVV